MLVSYDINKDGVKVAVLTFVKSAYRLGETVMCVVEFNNPDGRGRVLKASLFIFFISALANLSIVLCHARGS